MIGTLPEVIVIGGYILLIGWLLGELRWDES